MAITKIWAVKDDLRRVLNYIENPDKTKEEQSDGLKEVLAYTTQGYKTNEKEYITGINCEPSTSLKQMMNTKLSYNKMDGRLAFHAVQSFKPGEVTPEECHSLGVQLAKQMWGNRFEVVVSTHLDKDHLHNHFVVNSVSWVDGKKFTNCKKDYQKFKQISDSLCRDNDLSIVHNPEKGKHYSEWKAEKEGKPYFRMIVKNDVDYAISQSFTMNDFINEMENLGYVVSTNHKYISVLHPKAKRMVRLKSLTRDNLYSEENIMKRILNNSMFIDFSDYTSKIKCEYYNGKARKLHGFQALYFKYLYVLGAMESSNLKKRHVSPLLREDLIYLDKITNENTFVGKHNLETIEDVLAFKVSLNKEIESWRNQRKSIYNKIKRTRDPNLKKQLETDRDTLTSKIAHGKKEIKICEDIEKRVPNIEKKLKLVSDLEVEKEKQKEKVKEVEINER